MLEFESEDNKIEGPARRIEELSDGFDNSEDEGNQGLEEKASPDLQIDESGSRPSDEDEINDQIASTEFPIIGESNNDNRKEMIEMSEQISSGEVPSADLPPDRSSSVQSEEETVKSPEPLESEDHSPKDETIDDLAHIIEAIIFASDEPLGVGTIRSVLDASHTFGRIHPDMIISRINALNGKYDSDGSGFHIIEIAEGYQFATRKELAQWVSFLFKEKAKRKLSNSALETLAIIAYKQPITKPEVESIRGVNVDYVLHSLLEKEIVTVVGRAETVGRPLLYGTTQRFLKIFGLKNLEDLPKLREIEEIIKEIRSKGAEESIQLEITALGDQIATEPISPRNTGLDTSIKDSEEKLGSETPPITEIDDKTTEE